MLKKYNVSLLLMLSATISLPLQAADSVGYWLNSTGDMVRTGYGECWRDMDWSNKNAITGCEGGMKVEPAPVPESDSDSDGVVDSKDKCPGTATGTTVDVNGCAKDSDKDGVVDNNDNCPETGMGITVDTNGCAKDSDGDGVADSYDRCTNTPSGVEVDATGCKINTDEDNDGIANADDDCAGTAAGTVVNNRGCELKADIALDNVQFKTGTAELSSESRNILDNVAQVLTENKHLNFEVAGHSDNTGNYKSNIKLSESRAKSVRQYLIDHGVASERLSAQGYGSDKPVASNDTREGRSQNRRVELVLK